MKTSVLVISNFFCEDTHSIKAQPFSYTVPFADYLQVLRFKNPANQWLNSQISHNSWAHKVEPQGSGPPSYLNHSW